MKTEVTKCVTVVCNVARRYTDLDYERLYFDTDGNLHIVEPNGTIWNFPSEVLVGYKVYEL